MPEFTTPQIISIVVFIVVFALIISEKVHRTVAALAGYRCYCVMRLALCFGINKRRFIGISAP